MSSSSPRRIAPAPSFSQDETMLPTRQDLTTYATKSGIKRASIACTSCQQIKRKCDQKQPCSNCIKTGTECIFDQAQDGRRRAARKRNVEELELKRDALDTILEALRNSGDDQLQHLLTLIRGDSPLRNVIQFAATIEQHIPQEFQLISPTVAVDDGLGRKSVLSVNDLCDTPLLRVPATPWTTVTNDDALVSHLISIYFAWVHYAYPIIVPHLFITAMIERRLDSAFCSPLLVNSMLALACQFSDQQRALDEIGNGTSRGRRFLGEALRLWTEESGRLKLSTFQAGQSLAITLTLVGKDRMSVFYIDQLNEMGRQLSFKAQQGFGDWKSIDVWNSLVLATWSLFQLSVSYSLSFMRSRLYDTPTTGRVTNQDEAFRLNWKWVPYPDSQPIINTEFATFANLRYDLHEIGSTIANLLFNTNHKHMVRSNNLWELNDRLLSFSSNLPVLEDGETVSPHVIDLHLIFHWLRITLFHFFQASGSPDVNYQQNAKPFEEAKFQCISSAKRIVELYKRYFKDFSVKRFTIWMPQTALSTAYMLIEYLDDSEVQDLFHDVCVVVTYAARKWFVMRGHVRMLFMTAEQKGKVIPAQTKHQLSTIALDSWPSDGHKHFNASMYPNYALARYEDPQATGMGSLLEEWANLNLEADSDDQMLITPVDSMKPMHVSRQSESVTGKAIDPSNQEYNQTTKQ